MICSQTSLFFLPTPSVVEASTGHRSHISSQSISQSFPQFSHKQATLIWDQISLNAAASTSAHRPGAGRGLTSCCPSARSPDTANVRRLKHTHICEKVIKVIKSDHWPQETCDAVSTTLCPRNVSFGSSARPGELLKRHSFLPLCNSGQILTTHVQRSSTVQLLLQLDTADLTNRHLSDNILKITTHKLKTHYCLHPTSIHAQ